MENEQLWVDVGATCSCFFFSGEYMGGVEWELSSEKGCT